MPKQQLPKQQSTPAGKSASGGSANEAPSALLPAHPPVKRKGLLLFFSIVLAVWLAILASLAAYSVWG